MEKPRTFLLPKCCYYKAFSVSLLSRTKNQPFKILRMTLITLITALMMFNMPTLPYAHNALEPVISQATIDFHYGKHLQTYVNNLNNLVPGTAFEGKTLEEIVATAPDGPVFNNAGQVLNHTFYFLQFAPSPARHEPEGPLADAIRRDFGSFDNFKKEFTAAATSLFGSGWAWLSADKDGKLHITKEANGSNPLRAGLTPLLTFDVWEHAYYLDYQNRRADHLTVEERFK